ncbi:hypothetical protein I7I48_03761 [Histoplasma ohiense]|nr:hypothetical protein I7I48_03761 [Histoplasma ohiense (nom. inval.)]
MYGTKVGRWNIINQVQCSIFPIERTFTITANCIICQVVLRSICTKSNSTISCNIQVSDIIFLSALLRLYWLSNS